MLVFGTEMHIVTFIFISIEIVIFFHLLIYKLARPDDKIVHLNILLIFLLIIYNLTGGLLPDDDLPGSYFSQVSIAYATGFIVPCYFPYYVYRAFGLEKMKFHAFRGVILFLMLPYFLFVLVFSQTNNLKSAQELLVIPVAYALWVIFSLYRAIRYKYGNNLSNRESKEEVTVLFLSLTPWVSLPAIAYFNLSQALEATITNVGFLLLLSLQVNRHIKKTRLEYKRLIVSEQELTDWNSKLQVEVEKRTNELEKMNEQKTNNFINLVHETRTPLTLISGYLEEYISKNGADKELNIVKNGVNKLTRDVMSLFDVEKFKRGFEVYKHTQTLNLSKAIKEGMLLFQYHCEKNNIECIVNVEDGIYIKADINAINRIVNNLVENAIKFCGLNGQIEVNLTADERKIYLSVKDSGAGIPLSMQNRIFEPYYQINNKKTSQQGMGLGLPIVKKVIQSLDGEICVESNPQKNRGTIFKVVVERFKPNDEEPINNEICNIHSDVFEFDEFAIMDKPFDPNKKSILIVEDSKQLMNFIYKKLSDKYNIHFSFNGLEALKKLQELQSYPDLILSDIMMDKMDGFSLAKAISEQQEYNHIPFIFLTAKFTPTDKIKALQIGAIDFIQKPFSVAELQQKIEAVLNQVERQKAAILNQTIAQLQNPRSGGIVENQSCESSMFEQRCKSYNLTNREIELVGLVNEGLKYKAIGENLYISERTVTKHVQNIFEKVGVSNRIELLKKLHS